MEELSDAGSIPASSTYKKRLLAFFYFLMFIILYYQINILIYSKIISQETEI